MADQNKENNSYKNQYEEARKSVINAIKSAIGQAAKESVVQGEVGNFTNEKSRWEEVQEMLRNNKLTDSAKKTTDRVALKITRVLQAATTVNQEIQNNTLAPSPRLIPQTSLPLLVNLDAKIGTKIELQASRSIFVAPIVNELVNNSLNIAALKQRYQELHTAYVDEDRALVAGVREAIIQTATEGRLGNYTKDMAEKEFDIREEQQRAKTQEEKRVLDAQRRAAVDRVLQAVRDIEGTFNENWRPTPEKMQQLRTQVEEEVRQAHRGLKVDQNIIDAEVKEKLTLRINEARERITSLLARMNQIYVKTANEERAQKDFTSELSRLLNEGYITADVYTNVMRQLQEMKTARQEVEDLSIERTTGNNEKNRDLRSKYETVNRYRTTLEREIMKDAVPQEIKEEFVKLFKPLKTTEERRQVLAQLRTDLMRIGQVDLATTLTQLEQAEEDLRREQVSPEKNTQLFYRYDPNQIQRIETDNLTSTYARQGVIDYNIYFTPAQIQLLNAMDNVDDFIWLLKSYGTPERVGTDTYNYRVDFMNFYKDVKSIFQRIINSSGFGDSDYGAQMQLQYYRSLLKQFQSLALNIPSRDRGFANNEVDVLDITLYPDENQGVIGMVPRNQFARPHMKPQKLLDALTNTLPERLGNLHNALSFSSNLQKAIDAGKGYSGIQDYINALSTEDIDWMFFEDPELVKAYNMYRESLSEVLSMTRRTIGVDFGKVIDKGLPEVELRALRKLLAYTIQNEKVDETEIENVRTRLRTKIRIASGLAKGYYGEDWRTLMGARLPVDYDVAGDRPVEETNPDGTFKRDESGNIIYRKRKKLNPDGSVAKDAKGNDIMENEVLINRETGLPEQALKLNYRYKLTHSGGVNGTLGKLSPAAMWNFSNGPSFLPFVRRAAIPRDYEEYAPIEAPTDPGDPYGLTVERRKYDSLVRDRYDHNEIYEYAKEWDETLLYGYSKKMMDYLYRKLPYEDFTLRAVMDNLDKGGWRTQQFMAYIVREPKGKPTIVNQGYEDQASKQETVVNFRATMQNMMSLGAIAVRDFIKSPDVFSIDADTYKDIMGVDKPANLTSKDDKKMLKAQEKLRLRLVEKYIFGRDIRTRPTRAIAHERREFTPRGEKLVIDRLHDFFYIDKKFRALINEGKLTEEFLSTELLPFFVDGLQIVERKAQYDRRELFVKEIGNKEDLTQMVKLIYRGLSDQEKAYVENPDTIPQEYSKTRAEILKTVRSLRQEAYSGNLTTETIKDKAMQWNINKVKGELLDYEFTLDEFDDLALQNSLRLLYRESKSNIGKININGNVRTLDFMTEDEFVNEHLKNFAKRLKTVLGEERYTDETKKMKTTLAQRHAFMFQHFGSFKYDIGGDDLDLSRMPSQQGGANAVARDAGAGAKWEGLATEFETFVTKSIPDMVMRTYPDAKSVADASKVLNDPINKIADFLKSSDIQSGRHFTTQMLMYFSAMAGEDAVFRPSILGEVLEIANRNWSGNKRQASLYTDFIPVYMHRPTTAFSMDQMEAIGLQVAHATKLPIKQNEAVDQANPIKKYKFGPFTFTVPNKKAYESGGKKIWTLEEFRKMDGQVGLDKVINRWIPVLAVATLVALLALMFAARKKNSGK